MINAFIRNVKDYIKRWKKNHLSFIRLNIATVTYSLDTWEDLENEVLDISFPLERLFMQNRISV